MNEQQLLSMSKLSSKKQITIKKSVCDILNLREQDEVAFFLNDKDEVVLKKIEKRS